MSLSLFQTNAFRSLMREHLYTTLAFLLEEGQEFAVAADVEHLVSDPELPRHVTQSFGETALFVLGGYTFESSYTDEEYLYFEAGFGEEHLGANITLPLLAIKQIFVDEYPLTLNIASPAPFRTPQETSNRSMEALLRNPENQKLLRGKNN